MLPCCSKHCNRLLPVRSTMNYALCNTVHLLHYALQYIHNTIHYATLQTIHNTIHYATLQTIHYTTLQTMRYRTLQTIHYAILHYTLCYTLYYTMQCTTLHYTKHYNLQTTNPVVVIVQRLRCKLLEEMFPRLRCPPSRLLKYKQYRNYASIYKRFIGVYLIMSHLAS